MLRHTGTQPLSFLTHTSVQRPTMGAQESKSSDSDDYFVAAYETRTVLVRRVEASYYDVSKHLERATHDA